MVPWAKTIHQRSEWMDVVIIYSPQRNHTRANDGREEQRGRAWKRRSWANFLCCLRRRKRSQHDSDRQLDIQAAGFLDTESDKVSIESKYLFEASEKPSCPDVFPSVLRVRTQICAAVWTLLDDMTLYEIMPLFSFMAMHGSLQLLSTWYFPLGQSFSTRIRYPKRTPQWSSCLTGTPRSRSWHCLPTLA